jgi:hypothetical protein
MTRISSFTAALTHAAVPIMLRLFLFLAAAGAGTFIPIVLFVTSLTAKFTSAAVPIVLFVTSFTAADTLASVPFVTEHFTNHSHTAAPSKTPELFIRNQYHRIIPHRLYNTRGMPHRHTPF